MKKILLSLFLVLTLTGVSQAGRYFGTFGTATEVDDTCKLHFTTFDTLGHSAEPLGDSIYILRFVRGTLVDSTSATKLRNYYWGITKKAYDGTNLGEYSVICYWRPVKNIWYNDDGYYTVEAETVQAGPVTLDNVTHTGATIPTVTTTGTATSVTNDVGITQAGADKAWGTATKQLTSAQTFNLTGDITGNLSGSVGSVTGAVGSVTGAVGSVTAEVDADVTKISGDATAANNAELFFDGTGYAGTNNVIPTVTTTTNLTTNNDKTGYGLVDDAITAAKIAASAITSSEAPNLDAAITSRATQAGVDSLKTALILASGDVVDTVTNSSSEFKVNLTNAVDNHYNAQILVFTSGTNAGQSRMVSDYVGAAKYVKVTPAFEVEPTAADDFVILALKEEVRIASDDTIGTVSGNVDGSVASVTAGVSLANNAFTRAATDTSAYARLWGDDTTRIVTDFDDMDSDLDNIVLYTDGDGSDGIDADIDAIKTATDSLIAAIADANKENFMRWSAAQRDSILNTILDANKVNYYIWTSTQRDSVLNTILDANKVNYMRWTAAQRDSVLNTILDANKANYKATGFATSAQGDSVTQSIADANKGNFKATGFATSSDFDSVNNAIADANKGNFKATIPDSSRAYLATHDSTLLEQAASAGASKITGMDPAVYDTIAHNNYDTMLTHAADFKYGGADSTKAYLATHDSTLLEQAASAGVSKVTGMDPAVYDTIAHEVYDTMLAHADDFKDGSAGAGTEQETLFVFDGDTNAVEGAKVSWWNSSGTLYASHTTDANGKRVFLLDIDTYEVGVSRIGIHNKLDTLAITADGTDTIWVTAYSPSIPSDPSVCAVWVTATDVGLNKLDRFEIVAKPYLKSGGRNLRSDAGGLIFASEYKVYADTGYAEIQIPRSALLRYDYRGSVIDTVSYNFTITMFKAGDVLYIENVEIPDSATYHLVDAL